MDDLVSRITRELPDTDRDRYDIAYQRGRAQARSTLLFGGMVLGAAAGAVATLLLDPARGRGRRVELSQRLGAVARRAGRTAQGRATDLRNRATGKATELGLPGTGTSTEQPAREPVAEPASVEPVPVFDDTSTRAWRVTDDELEPVSGGAGSAH